MKKKNYFHYYKNDHFVIVAICILAALVLGIALIIPLADKGDAGLAVLILLLPILIGVGYLIEHRYYREFSPIPKDASLLAQFDLWYSRVKDEKKKLLVAKKVPTLMKLVFWICLPVFMIYLLTVIPYIELFLDSWNLGLIPILIIQVIILLICVVFLIWFNFFILLRKPYPWHGEKYSSFAKDLIFQDMLQDIQPSFKFETILGNGVPMKEGCNLNEENPIFQKADNCYSQMIFEKDLVLDSKFSDEEKNEAIKEYLNNCRENGSLGNSFTIYEYLTDANHVEMFHVNKSEVPSLAYVFRIPYRRHGVPFLVYDGLLATQNVTIDPNYHVRITLNNIDEISNVSENVIQLLKDFYDKYHILYRIVVKDSKIYYQFFVRDIFKISLLQPVLSKKALYQYYVQIYAIHQLIKNIGNSMGA